MHLSRVNTQSLMLQLSENELLIFKSCLREVFATLDRNELSLRVGAPIEIDASLAEELTKHMQVMGIEE